MQQLNTLFLTLLLALLLVIVIAYWYAALAVAAITLLYFTAKGITTFQSHRRK